MNFVIETAPSLIRSTPLLSAWCFRKRKERHRSLSDSTVHLGSSLRSLSTGNSQCSLLVKVLCIKTSKTPIGPGDLVIKIIMVLGMTQPLVDILPYGGPLSSSLIGTGVAGVQFLSLPSRNSQTSQEIGAQIGLL